MKARGCCQEWASATIRKSEPACSGDEAATTPAAAPLGTTTMKRLHLFDNLGDPMPMQGGTLGASEPGILGPLRRDAGGA